MTIKDIDSRKLGLEAELARAEALIGSKEVEARKSERKKMAAELTALNEEQAKLMPSLRKAAQVKRSARLKTERLLKKQREAELHAVQVLTEMTNQIDARIAQIEQLLR